MKKTPEQIAREVENIVNNELIHEVFYSRKDMGVHQHKEKHIKRIVKGVMEVLGYKANIEIVGHGKTEDGYDCLIVKV